MSNLEKDNAIYRWINYLNATETSSSRSVSCIFGVDLLLEREPRRQTNVDLKMANETRVLIHAIVNNLQKDIENRKKEDKETITIQRKLDEKTRELEKIIEYKTKGAILRSKCRWHNEGEKNTKYFLNLEKRHYKNSVITQLKMSDTDFISSDNEILNEYAKPFIATFTAPKQIPLIVATSFLTLRVFDPWTLRKRKNAKAP